MIRCMDQVDLHSEEQGGFEFLSLRGDDRELASAMKILIVEDSEKLRRSLAHGLRRFGYTVDVVDNGPDGLDYARHEPYDVVVLDLMLPGMDGFTVLERLRQSPDSPHVLILSARDHLDDRVRGLELGADDYLVKPFEFRELLARVQALTRRKYHTKRPDLEIGSLRLDSVLRGVFRNGERIPLTPGEFNLLEHLALQADRVQSKERLLRVLQGVDGSSGENMVEVMICNLRRKMGPEATLLRTVRGFGYTLERS
jgi:two-component system copper resistance phosphate regulon response regulator CusR